MYNDEYCSVECAAILYSNEKGDICDITTLRWAKG